MNWLIVEDEADIRSLVSMMCQVWGNTPLAYESGQKAWEWLDTVESGQYKGAMPDFALMDIRMPGKRGNEIAARIRTVEKLKDIPIVLMTAFVMSEDEMNQMKKDFGVDAVINKPLPDFDRLRTVLYDIINRKKAEVAASAPTTPTSTPPPPAPTPAPAPTPITNTPPTATVTETPASSPTPTATVTPPPVPTTDSTAITQPSKPNKVATDETPKVEATPSTTSEPPKDQSSS
ncbi:MAG: hypothetical protein CUN52_03335 [Phototrophicales bacterium]|nr:MAG: hypothetical protein CUN52_03335 [Phototrophicales bacterium]